MKHIHSIINDWYRDDDLPFLAQLGIKIEPGIHDWHFDVKRGRTTLEEMGYGVDPEVWEWRMQHDKPHVNKRINVPEGPVYDAIHERYSDKKSYPWYREDKVFDYFEYSRKEILESEYCMLMDIPYKGYPQPDGDGTWKEIVYDSTRRCAKCGQGKFQVGDFRISAKCSKPMWSFFAWVHDVIFVTPELYGEVFEPLGIGCRTVRKRSGKIFEGVLQLDLPVIDESLDLSMYDGLDTCPVCGRSRPRRSLFPFFPIQDHPLPHIYLSKEHFGAGGQSNRRIFISTELAKQLIDRKVIKYDNLIPCKKNLAEYLKTIEY